MKLSVIIPAYQTKKFAHECFSSVVDSICHAGLQEDAEIIIVDDGSPDDTGVICDEYAATCGMIQTIHQINKGVSGARNTGLLLARGDIVSFIDSDDAVTIDFYSELLYAMQCENADIVCCGMTILNSGLPYLPPPAEPRIYPEGSGILALLERDGTQDFMMNKIYKRSLFEGIEFLEGKTYEDVFIQHRIFSKSKKTVFLNSSLYLYRINDSGLTHNKSFKPHMMDFVLSTGEQLAFTSTNFPAFLPFATAKHLNAVCQVARYMYRNNHTPSRRESIGRLVTLAKQNRAQIQSNPYLSPLLRLELSRLAKGVGAWCRYCKKTDFVKELHNHPRAQGIAAKLFGTPLDLPRNANQY